MSGAKVVQLRVAHAENPPAAGRAEPCAGAFYPDTLWRVLSANSWFSSLEGATQETLVGSASLQMVPPGRAVNTGSGQGALVGLLRGALQVACAGGSGEVVADLIEPGQWFGRGSGVLRAMKPSTVLTLDDRALRSVFDACPDMPRALARLNSEIVDRLLQRFAGLAASTYQERVRHALALMAQRFGTPLPNGWRAIVFKFNQSEIAALAGVSRQSTNKAMCGLAAQGLVRTTGGRLELNATLLQRAATAC